MAVFMSARAGGGANRPRRNACQFVHPNHEPRASARADSCLTMKRENASDVRADWSLRAGEGGEAFVLFPAINRWAILKQSLRGWGRRFALSGLRSAAPLSTQGGVALCPGLVCRCPFRAKTGAKQRDLQEIVVRTPPGRVFLAAGMLIWSAATCRSFHFQRRLAAVNPLAGEHGLKSKAMTSHRSPKPPVRTA